MQFFFGPPLGISWLWAVAMICPFPPVDGSEPLERLASLISISSVFALFSSPLSWFIFVVFSFPLFLRLTKILLIEYLQSLWCPVWGLCADYHFFPLYLATCWRHFQHVTCQCQPSCLSFCVCACVCACVRPDGTKIYWPFWDPMQRENITARYSGKQF